MTDRLMPGLSDAGFALVVEMLANEAIDIDAILAYVVRTETFEEQEGPS